MFKAELRNDIRKVISSMRCVFTVLTSMYVLLTWNVVKVERQIQRKD